MKFNKIISIGDLHGDFKAFTKVLLMCGLIDKFGYWSGKDAYLIQVGDTLDGKRPGVTIDPEFKKESGEVEIMKYILELDSQAKKKGGRVISLLGNHELYPHYLQNDKNFINDFVKKTDLNKFKKVYKMDRMKFLRPGEIGGSLMGRTRPLILQLGEFIFIHGSVTDKMIAFNLNGSGKVDIDKINKETSAWLQGLGKIPKYLEEMDDNNPLFSREYSESKTFNKTECKKIETQLSFFDNANYIVMGHSRFKDIHSACNKMLIRTDVSLSRAFGGKVNSKKYQALEILQFSNEPPEISIISRIPGGEVLKVPI